MKIDFESATDDELLELLADAVIEIKNRDSLVNTEPKLENVQTIEYLVGKLSFLQK